MVVKDENYAELYGIMLGDGCIASNKKGIYVSGDSLTDEPYIINFVRPLIEKVFHARPKIYYSKNERRMNCVLYRKAVCEILEKNGFPVGKKNPQNPKIPDYFFKDKKLLAACLRGFFDTDGSICHHKNAKVIIDFTSYSPTLLKSIKNAIDQFEIPASTSKKYVQIYGPKRAKLFFEKIGSSNPKHIAKYQHYLDHGRVMRAYEWEAFLKINQY